MTTHDKNNKTDTDRIEEPLDSLDGSLTRRCHNCGEKMSASVRETEKYAQPWGEKGIRFICNHCEESVWIASKDTIIVSTASGLLVVLGILYMLSNGFMSFISMGFESGVLWSLLSLLLILLVIIFAIGSLINIRRGVTLFINNRKYPIIDAPKHSTSTVTVLLLGLMPWLLVTGTGYINFTYFNDSGVVGAVGLALFAMPLAFANKLGASARGVFLSMVMWFVVGGGFIWLYNAW